MAAKRTAPDNRVRTKNLVIRMGDRERMMLDAVAEHEELTISDTIRWLVRRQYEALPATSTKSTKTKSNAKGSK